MKFGFLFVCLLLLISACLAMEIPLSQRPGPRARESLRQFVREHLDWPEDRKIPLNFKYNSPYSEKEGAALGVSRALSVTLPLYGNVQQIGVVYMNLNIGTPSHVYTAQVDTGSSDLGLPATGCTTCGSVPQVYNPTQSTTSSRVACSGSGFTCPVCTAQQCGYDIGYADGSGYRARLYLDKVALANFTINAQSVGGISKETLPSGGTFEPANVDGIIGFAYQSLSETNSPTIIDSLVASGSINNIFSICIAGSGGALGLGFAMPYYTGDVQYTPIRSPLYFYAVTLNDISIGGTSFGLPSSTYNSDATIVDSGSTDLLLPVAAYSKFQSILVANCSHNPLVGVCNTKKGRSLFDGYCYVMTANDIAAFPPLIFHLNGATLSIPASVYLVSGYCSQSNYYALAVDPIGEYGVIFGDVVHRQYTVIYDRTNLRIGFGLAQGCPSH